MVFGCLGWWLMIVIILEQIPSMFIHTASNLQKLDVRDWFVTNDLQSYKQLYWISINGSCPAWDLVNNNDESAVGWNGGIMGMGTPDLSTSPGCGVTISDPSVLAINLVACCWQRWQPGNWSAIHDIHVHLWGPKGTHQNREKYCKILPTPPNLVSFDLCSIKYNFDMYLYVYT